MIVNDGCLDLDKSMQVVLLHRHVSKKNTVYCMCVKLPHAEPDKGL